MGTILTITHDLQNRRSSRKLHPALRSLIEKKVFTGGIIPDCFLQKDIPSCVILIAKSLESLKIRESGGANKGEIVGYIQAIIGPYFVNGTGDPWCMSTVQCIVAFIEDFFQVESPVPDTESVMNCYTNSRKIVGLLSEECEVGTFFLFQNGSKWYGHAGTVLEVLPSDKMNTFEGNTGDKSARDGDGAYFRMRDQHKNGLLVTKGFLRVYPENKI